MNRCLIIALVCLWTALTHGNLSANPSSRSPNQPLAVHATVPEAAQMASTGLEVVNAAEKFLEQIESPKAPMKLSMAIANNLYRFRGELPRTMMHGERLSLMGEPIGNELIWRAATSQGKIHQFVLRAAGAPEAAKFRQKLLQDLDRSMPKREERLTQIRQWIASGEIDQAAAAYDEIVVFINSTIYFLSPTDVAPRLGTFLSTGSELSSAATKPRALAARQKFEEAVTQQLPDTAELTQCSKSVSDSIRTTGQAKLADESLGDGAACLAELIDRWGDAHAAWQHIAGLRWASHWHAGGSQNPFVMSDLDSWNEAVTVASLQIIEADAQSIQPNKVPGRHQAYLQVIANELPKLGSTKFTQQALTALEKLLARNPTYAQSVENYEAATRDVLVFRSRAAGQATQSLRSDFPPWNTVVATHARTSGQQLGLFPEQSNLAYPSLSGSATATINSISPKLVDQAVSIERVTDLGAQSKTAAASLRSGCYATVLQVRLPEPELAKINAALMVSPEHPPLSLAAADAITSARTGNYIAAGGKVVAVHLEPTLSRFITMPNAASVIVPYGEIPQSNEQTMMNQLLVRADILTAWVQHRMGVYNPK